MPREPRSTRTLTWIGTGIGLLALAFTLRPVKAPSWAFWAVIGLGVIVLGIGCVPLVRRALVRAIATRDTSHESLRRAKAATDCRHARAALRAFIDERARQRPLAMFGVGADRIDHWAEETLARYRAELRPWLRRVFLEAVACDVVSESALPLVDAPSVSQLGTLLDIFRDAAVQLDRPA